MKDLEAVQGLYKVCGGAVLPVMAARLVGAPATDLAETWHELMPNFLSGARGHDAIAFERKMWRARRLLKILAALPFVRAVAICNSLGLHLVHEKSDIDIFVIAAAGRVWSARWWVTGLLALLRLRPGESARDPMCASFFVDETVVDLGPLKIENDIYFDFWQRSLLPIYGEHILFAEAALCAPHWRVQNKFIKVAQKILEFGAQFLAEERVRGWQEKIFPEEINKAAERPDSAVVLTDTIIKLHDNDRRAAFRDQILENAKGVGQV